MATDLTYNGVTLKNVLTRSFEQEPVYDESGTDILYQKFTVSVEAIANADLLLEANPTLGTMGVGVGGGAAGQVIQSARIRLAETRGAFVYQMEGNDILTSSALLDANNGPKPRQVKIAQVSPNTLRIMFTIEVCKVDCTENPSPVINNRWSCTDDIDDNYRTVRTWRGRLRLSNAVYNPQFFRKVVLPVLPKGWRRTRMHFNAPPNTLELEYWIQDTEMLGEHAPRPAVKMSCVHTESMEMAGMNNIGSITVRLDGSRTSDKRQMLERAMQIAIAKLAIDQLSNTQGILKNLDIVDYFGESTNSVEVRARMTRIPGNGGVASGLGAILALTFGKPLKLLNIPSYDPDRGVIPSAYGTAGDTPAGLAGLFACYLQSPCNDIHGMPQQPATGNADPLTTSDSEPSQATYTESSPVLGLDTPESGQDHILAAYQYCRMESILDVSNGRVALPIARAEDDEDDSTQAVVRLTKAHAKRTIRYSAERLGLQPQMWNPVDFTDANGIKHSLLDFTPTFQPAQLDNLGRPVFALDVEYVYALSKVPGPSQPFSVGSLPWDGRTAAENVYPAAVLIQPGAAKGLK